MIRKTAAAGLMILLVGAVAAPAQHHPFSQLFPADADLQFGGKDLLGATTLETGNIRANSTGAGDLVFLTGGNAETLRWDDSAGRWVYSRNLTMVGSGLPGGVNMFGSIVANAGGLNFQDSGGDGVQWRLTESSDMLTIDASDTWSDVIQFDTSRNVYIPNGNLSMGSNNIVNLADPNDPQDAATKSYVDTELGNQDASTTNEIQNLSEVLGEGNSAGTYNLNMNLNRIEGLGTSDSGDDAMRKDNIQSTFVERAGDSMTGSLDMGSNAILNIGDGSILENDISQNTLDDSEIQDNSLSASSMAAGSVTDSEIANSNAFSMASLDLGSPGTTGQPLDVGGGANFGGNVNMNGNDIVLGNTGGTGTADVKGTRELYAGDETEVTTASSTYVLKKELTMVFDDNVGKKPRYVNVIVRIKNAYARVNISSSSKTVSTTSNSYVMKTMTFDVSGFADDAAYPASLEIKTNGGTAYNDIIEFYYVQ